MRIHIAEDDDITSKMLCSLLRRWGYEVIVYTDGLEAWQRLSALDEPELVLLDWQMPGLDGVEVCRRLRSEQPALGHYVVLLTSRSEIDDIVAGLQSGADDYLTKPFDKSELRARISVGTRTLDLQRHLSQSLSTIENTMQRLQKSFLWGRPPTILEGCSVAAEAIAHSKAAGDFYDYWSITPRQFDVVIGDVMGKGIIAALLGAATCNEALRAHRDLLAEGAQEPSPAMIVERLTNYVSGQFSDIDSFVTLVYCRVDVCVGTATLVSCGHPSPLVYSVSDKTCVAVECRNTPLGFPTDGTPTEATVGLESGDILLLYTDGITEAMNADGDLFGEARLAICLASSAGLSPVEILSSIRQAVHEFVGGETFRDDSTCVVVKID